MRELQQVRGIAPARALALKAALELGRRFASEGMRPGEPFTSARQVWNGSIDCRPRLIVQCRTVDDVLTAVESARSTDLRVAVRGGAHSIAGFSTTIPGRSCSSR